MLLLIYDQALDAEMRAGMLILQKGIGFRFRVNLGA